MHIGVLIADDEEDIRTLIRMIIEGSGQGLSVVGEAGNGRDAITQAESLDPDVIVLDERMPGMSGLDTAAVILGRRPGQRIVMCSSYTDEEFRQRAEELGIRICLTKAQVNQIPDVLCHLMAEVG